jgi:hypothetical protein
LPHPPTTTTSERLARDGESNPREATVHIVKKLIPLCAVAASLTGVILAAGPASAAPVYAKGGNYQFASNYTQNGADSWLLSNSPFSYTDASQSLGAGGVTLSATGPNYASSGVIVDLGHLSNLFDPSGNYVPPQVTGTGPNFPKVLYNLFFDTNGDGTYFGWGSHDPYVYTGDMNGDNGAAMGQVNSTGDTADFSNFGGQASTPGGPALAGQTMSMEAVRDAFAARTDNTASSATNPEVWAWIGVQTTPDQTATIASVNENGDILNLVSTYAAPVTGLKVTPGYTSLTATWKPSSAATGYTVTVTQHNGSVIAGSATTTGTTCRIGHLKAKNTYAVKVIAQNAAPGQKATVVYTTTK